LKDYNSVIINGNQYNGLGYFASVNPAIVIEAEGELLKLFRYLKNNEIIVSSISFLKYGETVATFNERKYVVDSINRSEVELFPIGY
jgi:hypothetical protein